MRQSLNLEELKLDGLDLCADRIGSSLDLLVTNEVELVLYCILVLPVLLNEIVACFNVRETD